LSSLDRGVSSSAYVVVLAKDGASPIPPQSDDEKVKSEEKPGPEADKNKAGKKEPEKPKPTVVDLAGIGNRILALPIPPRNYIGLAVGKTGVLYLAEGSPLGRSSAEHGPPIRAIWRFTTEERKTEEVLTELTQFDVSHDGEKVFYAHGDGWFLIKAGDLKPGGAGQGKPVNNHGMFATVDPRAEYAQMYRETWRIERDFFYDPHLHGLDVQKIETKYEPYVAGLASRNEFTYLCNEML